jgi:membrane protease YdiL (CAAX protease family)
MGWIFYAFLLQIVGMAPISDEFHYVSDMSAWRIGLRILEMWFLVGLCEELLFRGYCLERIQSLLTGFSGKWRTSVAVTITSIVFSLWHLPILIHNVTSGQSSFIVAAENIGIMFWVGVGLAYLFIRSRNIILVVLVHGAMDFPLRDFNFILVFTVIACVETLRLVRQKRLKSLSVRELDGLSA